MGNHAYRGMHGRDRGYDGDNGYHGPGARLINPRFNRWGGHNHNYTHMQGYNPVDYSGGWNNNMHDQMLQQKVQMIFNRHDTNHSGQL